MATSGTYNFSPTRDQIIKQVLIKNNVIPDEGTPSPAQVNSLAFELEALLKTYQQVHGMPLWCVEIGSVPFEGLMDSFYSFINTVPLEIMQVWRRDNTNPSLPVDVEMMQLTRQQFNSLSNKQILGSPTQWYYDYHNTYGRLYVSPIPDPSLYLDHSILYSWRRPFQDAGITGSNNLDFPAYWTNAIVYGLAYQTSPNYGLPPAERGQLYKDWTTFLQMALEGEGEKGSMFIMPASR